MYLSPELFILFSAVSIYLFKSTKGFMLSSGVVLPHVSSYYGADFTLKDEKFDVDPKRHYFLHQYRNFKDDIFESAGRFNNILKFDFKDFYSSIDIDILFNELSDKLIDSDKWEHLLDENRLESLKYFFEFVMKSKSGLPQFDLNYMCGFIASLYMRLWELDVSHIISMNRCISGYRIVRYVDDVYIFFSFSDSSVNESFKSSIMLSLGEKIADISIDKYKIKVNDKTDIFFYNDPSAKEKLKRIVKNTSARSFGDDDYQDLEKNPQDLVESILHVLDLIIHTDNIFSAIVNNGDSEILKSVFDVRVAGLILSGDNAHRLDCILSKIKLEHVKVAPRPILSLITKSPKHEEILLLEIISMTEFSTSDEQIILDFICSTSSISNREALIAHLPQSSYFPQIKQLKGVKYKQESLYEIHQNGLEYNINLGDHTNLIFQGRQRKVAEWSKKWSLALNHLLNEIDYSHRAAFNRQHRDSSVNVLINDLMTLGISAENLLEIRKMFDRRHNNTISHPGNRHTPSLPIDRSEYLRYYRLSRIVIAHLIFKKID